MRAERSVTVGRPINEVFEYISTPENDPEWVSVARRHERTSPGPMGVGTTTEERVTFLRRRMRYTWVVTEYDPPRAIAYRATSGPLPGTLRLRLEPVRNGTVVFLAGEYDLKGAYRLTAPLLRLVVGRQFEEHLGRLKRLLECRPLLPDAG